MASQTVTQVDLDNINAAQSRKENKENLEKFGGVYALVKSIGVNLETGLTASQVLSNRLKFGDNSMPKSPSKNYFILLFYALCDTTLLILIAAASVSFAIGFYEDPNTGWIEGAAIFIAVFLVSNITAFNDYSKELQFRALEASSQQDERVSVFRNSLVELIAPSELVVGDIVVLQVMLQS
jgi:magnesium-transporting ATPase (P-type)